jgi:hypothetical protein
LPVSFVQFCFFFLCDTLLLFAVAARIEQVDLKTAAREGELKNEKPHYFVSKKSFSRHFYLFLVLETQNREKAFFT